MNRLTKAAQKLAVGVQILFGQQQCLAFEVEAAARAWIIDTPSRGLHKSLSLTTDKKGFKSVRDTPE